MMEPTMQVETCKAHQKRFIWLSKCELVVSNALSVIAVLILVRGDILPVLDSVDKQLIVFLNFDGSALADHFWKAYSCLWTWILLIGMTLYACMKNHPGSLRDRMLFLLTTVLLVVVLDQLSSGIIKPLAGRLRPSHDPAVDGLLYYVNGYRGGLYGFVSGHATNIVGLVTWMCFVFRDSLIRIVLMIFAAMMCYSRIYLGVHYLGDVLCGGLLGFGISWMAFHYLKGRIHLYSTNHRPYGIIVVYGLTLVAIVLIA